MVMCIWSSGSRLYCLSKTDGNQKINDDNVRAFILSCAFGHMNTIEWLNELSKIDENQRIDIRANNDAIFKSSCTNGHKNVAEWLCTLNDNYKIEYDNDKMVPLIRNIKSILLDNDPEEIKNL